MAKIKTFYLDKARYKARDELGNEFILDVDYWRNGFEISKKNGQLEKIAKDLLSRKHKVNFAEKLLK